jgi:uncharacterized membrane protein YfcA
MVLYGYLAAALIGISLGLIGGGGSILTVPVLVYLFSVAPALATSYSLFIVGSTSLVGAYTNYRKNQVDVQTAFLFGLSSIATVFITRKFIVPAIPGQLCSLAGISVSKATGTMVLFALLMLLASISMIRGNQATRDNGIGKGTIKNYPKLLLLGIGIGLITGLLGAGGGFLLIPALVMLVKLPMKAAVGTSLFIIALNSLIGFLGDIGHYQTDWPFLLTITGIAIAGIIIGGRMAQKIPGNKLKKGFGWFVLVMGIYIIAREVF